MQLAREVASFLFLRGHQPVGELVELAARFFHLAIARLGLPFQMPHPVNDDDGEDSAQDQSHHRDAPATRCRKWVCKACR